MRTGNWWKKKKKQLKRDVSARCVNMCCQMFGQVVGACKTFATHITVIRPFPSVNPQMASEVALSSKRSTAEEAHEGPLTCVLPHVQFQILLRSYTFSAEWTRKASFPLSFRCIRPKKTNNGGFLCVPERLTAAAGSCYGKSHGIDGIVLFCFSLFCVWRGSFTSKFIADVFFFYVDSVRVVLLDRDCFVWARYLIVAVFNGFVFVWNAVAFRFVFFGRSIWTFSVQPFQRMVQTMLFKRLQVPTIKN